MLKRQILVELVFIVISSLAFFLLFQEIGETVNLIECGYYSVLFAIFTFFILKSIKNVYHFTRIYFNQKKIADDIQKR